MSKETFEIHITGIDESLHDMAKTLGHKSITIKNLTKDFSVYSIHHMTSIIEKFNDYDECFKYTMGISKLYDNVRVKIECPPNPKYLEQAIYAEKHIKTDDRRIVQALRSWQAIMSLNVKNSHNIIYTVRKYSNFEDLNFFIGESEYCLYDSNVELDQGWINGYR